jgi:hypothetical protein
MSYGSQSRYLEKVLAFYFILSGLIGGLQPAWAYLEEVLPDSEGRTFLALSKKEAIYVNQDIIDGELLISDRARWICADKGHDDLYGSYTIPHEDDSVQLTDVLQIESYDSYSLLNTFFLSSSYARAFFRLNYLKENLAPRAFVSIICSGKQRGVSLKSLPKRASTKSTGIQSLPELKENRQY